MNYHGYMKKKISSPKLSKKSTAPSRAARSSSNTMLTALLATIAVVFVGLGFGLWKLSQVRTTESRANAAAMADLYASAFSLNPAPYEMHPQYPTWYRTTVNLTTPGTQRPTITAFYMVFKIKDWGRDTYSESALNSYMKTMPDQKVLVKSRPNFVTIPKELDDLIVVEAAKILPANNGDGVRVVLKAKFKSSEAAVRGTTILTHNFLRFNAITDLRLGNTPKADDLRFTLWGYKPGSNVETMLIEMPRRVDRPLSNASYSGYGLSDAEIMGE
jgi:hypothetical protein